MLHIQYIANVSTIVRFWIPYLNIFFLIFDLSSVNGHELEVGQENLYEDPCQDWLDLINNKLTSPNYPDKYDPRTVCKWHITTDKGNYISLDFEHIEVSHKR